MDHPHDEMEHPLLLEIASLKAALNHYQSSADTAGLNLQRQVLETSTFQNKYKSLEQQNNLLQTEIKFLRNVPDTTPHPSTLQVSEMTLALRRSSEKLDLVERSLLERTNELGVALAENRRANLEVEGAYALAASARMREGDVWETVRELRGKLRGYEEERRVSDLAIQEYADLVRSLEGRTMTTQRANGHSQEGSDESSNSRETLVGATNPLDSLSEGKAGIQRLLSEFYEQGSKAEQEITRLHSELDVAANKLQAAEKALEEERAQVASVKRELEHHVEDDRTATKLVSRYMSFSQQSTDLLQTALTTLKQRHAATLSTYEAQLSDKSKTIDRGQAEIKRLRGVMDELTKDISRESYGRRREVILRLALLERERKMEAALDKWIRKLSESRNHVTTEESMKSCLDEAVRQADATLRTMGEAWSLPGEDTTDARIGLALISVKNLTAELEIETGRRMELTRRFINNNANQPESNPITVHNSDPSRVQSQKEPSTTITPHPEPEPEPIPPIVFSEPLTPLPAASPLLSSSLQPELQKLFDGLEETSTRYTQLQSEFSNCHRTLVELKQTFAQRSTNESLQSRPPNPVLRMAIERLDDYCEDARVELEILVADEARIAQGYQTLLMVNKESSQGSSRAEGESPLQEIDDFINGNSNRVSKARLLYEKKLDDLLHDIAIVKHALHESIDASISEIKASTDPIHFPEDGPSGSWKEWTGGILPPPNRPTTPIRAQTFGSLMTSSNRNSRSSSTASLITPLPNPFSQLGLRIAMPESNPKSPASQGLSSWFMAPRSRTMSSAHLVGMGVRSASFSLTMNDAVSRRTSSIASLSALLSPSADKEADIE